MEHATQVRLLTELLHQLDNDVNLDAGRQLRIPATEYTCTALAAREWESFFTAHPQMIGLSGDLPTPGTFMTVADFGVNVLATRGEDGRFRAFVNACRHRGVQVANVPRGEATRFQCPFHHWTYSNCGELLGIPRARDFGDIDRRCHGLVALPAEEYGGMLWVHPDPSGTLDVEALLSGLGPEIANWGIGNLVYKGEAVIDKRLNWKLANDTFGETYHFARLHTQTLGRLLHGDATSHEVFGRNHRFAFPFRGIDGLRGKAPEHWRIGNGASVFYYLFPNIQMNVGPKNVSLVKIYPHPEGPGRSFSRIAHYFDQSVVNADNDPERVTLNADNVYDEDVRKGRVRLSLDASMHIFDSTVDQEDYAMGETTQRSAESGAIDYFVFGRNEAPLHHFHNTFRAALNRAPLDTLENDAG